MLGELVWVQLPLATTNRGVVVAGVEALSVCMATAVWPAGPGNAMVGTSIFLLTFGYVAGQGYMLFAPKESC